MGLVLRAENLAKRFRSGDADLTVFSGLSLHVDEGERLAIIGPSGTGKSTLLHLLGLLDRPSAGRIFLNGDDVTSLSDSNLASVRNRLMGFVWQMNTLLLEFTALENVMMPLLVRGTSKKSAEDEAQQRLAEVGLSARAHHRPGELSGGEQQRVALARALVTRPRILLADEPTGNLDEHTGEEVMSLLEHTHRTHNLTTVLVTHNPAFSARCHRILRLEAGVLSPWRLVEEAQKAD